MGEDQLQKLAKKLATMSPEDLATRADNNYPGPFKGIYRDYIGVIGVISRSL